MVGFFTGFACCAHACVYSDVFSVCFVFFDRFIFLFLRFGAFDPKPSPFVTATCYSYTLTSQHSVLRYVCVSRPLWKRLSLRAGCCSRMM